MAVQLYLSPLATIIQALTNLGAPLANGTLGVFVAGNNTVPLLSYTDSTGTTPNAQPIPLNSAGRLGATIGAPVAIWVPANTPHRGELRDAAGNLLAGGTSLDQLLGINDPTSVQQLLLPPTGIVVGSGADLVANAVKSYSTIAALRAFGAPTPIYSGQTLVAFLQGGAAVGDGIGGPFYWSATSAATDDGFNTIKPTNVSGVGRWLRVGQPTYDEVLDANSFTGTLTGFTGTAPTCTCTYKLHQSITANGFTAKWATLAVDTNNSSTSGTSNAATMTLTGIPADIVTNGFASQLCVILDAGAASVGWVVWAAGVLTFGKVPGVVAAFTASGQKGIQPFQIVYPVQ